MGKKNFRCVNRGLTISAVDSISNNNSILNKYIIEINKNIDDSKSFHKILENLNKKLKFNKRSIHFTYF